MGPYQIMEHTGEIGVLAQGGTLAEAFSEVAVGMFSFVVALDSVEEREARQVEVQAADVEALLVDWLNELLYYLDTEGFIFTRFAIEEMNDTHLKARCYGETLDPERHRFNIGPKAATYHMLEVRKDSEASEWRARVVIDI